MPRIAMRVDTTFDGAAPPLTQSRVSVRLRDGRTLVQSANGARGYPDQPAGDDELAAKFLACARKTLSDAAAARALEVFRAIHKAADVREVTKSLASG
jgi:2-methylcitrate dehydratase PrpD